MQLSTPPVASFTGSRTITGRKKDIVITAGGENLTPANLENGLKQSRWVDHDHTLEGGELIPTMKVKRNVVNDKHQDRFDSLYE